MEALAHVQARYTSAHPCPRLLSSPHDLTHLRLSPHQVLIIDFMDPESGNQPGINVDQTSGADPNIEPDFDEHANPLWSLYGEKAKEDDKVTLEDITSGMDGLLLFVRSLSSTLPPLLAPSY